MDKQKTKGGFIMKTEITRPQAPALLQKYNREPFHILHGLTVEGVMR